MPFTGPMAVDAAESMADAELMFPELWRGTECFAWDADGELYWVWCLLFPHAQCRPTGVYLLQTRTGVRENAIF